MKGLGGDGDFYDFQEHWKHLRITTPAGSSSAAVRLRIGAAKRFKKGREHTAVIWKVFMVAQKTFRKIDAPELLAEVAEGTVYGQRSEAEKSRTKGRY